MTVLSDIFPEALLDEMIGEGYVRVQKHPTAPYNIANYTEKTVYDSKWNDVTLQCRGLIYNRRTNEVVARPFKKFFNYGQTGAPVINATETVVVSDKMDGSLCITYKLPNGKIALATRGSFTSDQALHATELWNKKYSSIKIPDDVTLLFEILYPQNRIVLDYGKTDDLVLLGGVDIETGWSYTPMAAQLLSRWKGPVTEVFPYRTLAEALEASPRKNAEGFVIHAIESDVRIKIKQDDYVALHKIVTNLSERAVWEQIIAGKTREDIVSPLPDEFQEWAGNVFDRLCEDVDNEDADLRELYEMVVENLDRKYGFHDWGRKEFAQEVVHFNDKWAMFLLADGKTEQLHKELWKRAKPDAFLTPSGVTHNEDTA